MNIEAMIFRLYEAGLNPMEMTLGDCLKANDAIEKRMKEQLKESFEYIKSTSLIGNHEGIMDDEVFGFLTGDKKHIFWHTIDADGTVSRYVYEFECSKCKIDMDFEKEDLPNQERFKCPNCGYVAGWEVR